MPNTNDVYHVFYIDNEQDNTKFIQDSLKSGELAQFELQTFSTIEGAYDSLQNQSVNSLALISIDAKNSHHLSEFEKLAKKHPQLSIVILSKMYSKQLATDCLFKGAQDYLTITTLTPFALLRSLQIALIRSKMLFLQQQTIALFTNAPSGMLLLENNNIINTNHCFAQMLELNNVSAILNKSIIQYIHPSYNKYFVSWLSRIQKNNNLEMIEIILVKNNNQPIYTEMRGNSFLLDGKKTLCITVNDITEKKRKETEMQFLTNKELNVNDIDQSLMSTQISEEIVHAQQHHVNLALIAISIDQFKLIQETDGTHVTDLLIQSMLQRLRKSIKQENILFPMGTGKFFILLKEIADIHTIPTLLNNINQICSQSFMIHSEEMHLTITAGVSVYPENGIDSATIIKNAELALYQAKQRGNNNHVFFTASMTHHLKERNDLVIDLRRALQHDEFFLVYQPIIDIRQGMIVGLEALLRWKNGENILRPIDFLSVAEETGLIFNIGNWVLQAAAEQNISWQKKGSRILPISINLSTRQFHPDAHLFENVEAILQKYKLNPGCIEFEMSEKITVLDIGAEVLHNLKKTGIKLTIDDFGANYFSLNELKNYQINAIKIDRSLVATIHNNTHSLDIINAIIAIARCLNIEIVAEGIESENQVKVLNQQGCYFMQGNYFSEPLTAKEISPYVLGEKMFIEPLVTSD